MALHFHLSSAGQVRLTLTGEKRPKNSIEMERMSANRTALEQRRRDWLEKMEAAVPISPQPTPTLPTTRTSQSLLIESTFDCKLQAYSHILFAQVAEASIPIAHHTLASTSPQSHHHPIVALKRPTTSSYTTTITAKLEQRAIECKVPSSTLYSSPPEKRMRVEL